jgi:chloride channel 7
MLASSSGGEAQVAGGRSANGASRTGPPNGRGGQSIEQKLQARRRRGAVNLDAETVKEVDKFLKTKTSRGSRAVGGLEPYDKQQYAAVQTRDYLVPDTKREEAYQRSFTPQMRSRRALYIWGCYTVIAVVVAVVIVGALQLCDGVFTVRKKMTGKYLKKQDLPMAWLVWTASSVLCCTIACCGVLWQPAAASSGIPELIAYLNGCVPLGGKSLLFDKKMTDFRSWKTLSAKLSGMVLSIPSGLAIGPEGPIIHISSLLSHHSIMLLQRLFHRVMPPRYRFSVRSGERRDFLATGAACGICVAFRAPLAGCLFVIEEAASFYTTEHLEYTFFACIVAYLVTLTIGGGAGGTFTKFQQATGHFCSLYDVYDMLLFVLVATLGGTFGALFNHVVEHVRSLHSSLPPAFPSSCCLLRSRSLARCLPHPRHLPHIPQLLSPSFSSGRI